MIGGRSFGDWLRHRRRELDLTREELARQVGCAAITVRKLESEDRRPSKQIIERLADILQVAPDDRPAFLRFARGDPFAAPDGVAAPAQPAAPAASPAGPRHNVPPQLTSLIGREKEIAEVRQLLSTARLVTLTGAGGSGKTRLALEAAGGRLGEFAGGVWLVELAPLADPGLVPQSVATALGLHETPGRRLVDLLAEYLRPKRLLLLLDNCEHLLQACAELAENLLRACPQLTILATSREALSIAGESTFHVPSLSLPQPDPYNSLDAMTQSEAVRLFVERAKAVLRDFALTSANAVAVVEVCRRLDGIPLAIELAAARVNQLRVEQIAERLADRYRLLTSGSRASLPRHRTLAALFDWSYDLLSEAEQTVFRRLSVFAGGWMLEAAEAVGADEDEVKPTGLIDAKRSAFTRSVQPSDVLDLLRQLASKSLVVIERQQGAKAWYRILETIRQFALAKLVATGEADTLRRRHAEYYLALCDANLVGNRGLAHQAWFDRLALELDNLRAALTWSQSPLGNTELGLRLSAAMPMSMIGFAERRHWLEVALAHADAEPADLSQARASVLKWLGQMDGLLSDYAKARENLTRSLKLFQELGNSSECAWILERLGWTAREQGDTDTARLRLEESLALYRKLGDKIGLAMTLNTLGEVAVMQGDTTEAAGLLKEALTLSRESEHVQGIGWSLNHLGHVALLQGDYELAAQLHEESLPLFRGLHHNFIGVGEANQALGQTALAQGDATRAARHLREALKLFRFHGARAQISWCLVGLAGVAVLDEEPERAARLWRAAEALRQSIGARTAPSARATCERLMAAAREQLGDEAFDAAWNAGQALTLEQAIELALQSKVEV